MNPERREQILKAAAASAAKEPGAPVASNPTPVAPAGPSAPHGVTSGGKPKPYVRSSGDAVIRVIDENNPPTEVRTRGPGIHQRPAGPPRQPGQPRVMGARVVSQSDLQPGPRARTARSPGQYGAVVRQESGAPAAISGASVATSLRTPLTPNPSPAPQPQAPSVPGAAPATASNLAASIASVGQQQARTGSPVAPQVAGPSPLTVIMSQHQRPDTLEGQYRALIASGLSEDKLWCWVDPAGVRLNDRLLGALVRFGGNRHMGPNFRWSLVACVSTKYVMVIDDDCQPGPNWIRSAIGRLEQAEADGERLVIAAGGIRYTADQHDQISLYGPESLHREEVYVDVGRGAWLMPTLLAQSVLVFPPVGSPLSTGIRVAAATQLEDAPTIVLPYPHNDSEVWGMLKVPQTQGSISERLDRGAQQNLNPPADAFRRGDYTLFRSPEIGWKPLCVLAAEAAAEAAEAPTVETKPHENLQEDATSKEGA